MSQFDFDKFDFGSSPNRFFFQPLWVEVTLYLNRESRTPTVRVTLIESNR